MHVCVSNYTDGFRQEEKPLRLHVNCSVACDGVV